MPADPKTSAGARTERKAQRARLTRRIARISGKASDDVVEALKDELAWVKSRQQRYDGKKGGLGK